MSEYTATVQLPYRCEQLFALAADIESYPAFVPGYVSARILERSPERLLVEQRVGVVGHGFRFLSRAFLQPPHGLRITVDKGPMAGLRIDWHFAPVAGLGCRVRFSAQLRVRNPLLRPLVAGGWDSSQRRILAAFVTEAHRRFGSA